MLANFPPLLSSQSRIGMSDYDAIVLSLEARGQREGCDGEGKRPKLSANVFHKRVATTSEWPPQLDILILNVYISTNTPLN